MKNTSTPFYTDMTSLVFYKERDHCSFLFYVIMDYSQHPNRSICTIGCLCCAKLITNQEACVCWKPKATLDVSTQTDNGIAYGYSSESYFTRGNAAHSMLHVSLFLLYTASYLGRCFKSKISLQWFFMSPN